MADFAGPSFSLGLDLEADFADLPTDGDEEEDAHLDLPPSREIVEEDELDCEILGPNRDADPTSPPRALTRLRRGPPPRPDAPMDGGDRGQDLFASLDDEIEEFSSQEGRQHRDDCSSVKSNRTCSTSKLSLQRQGFLSNQSTSKSKLPQVSSAPNSSTLGNVEASSNKKRSSKIRASPLRKIQLLDSDSDDGGPSTSKDEEIGMSKGTKGLSSTKSSICKEKKSTSFPSKDLPKESFWMDFNLKQNVDTTTPALDEFCEEYFRSEKAPKFGQLKEGHSSASTSKITYSDAFGDYFEGFYGEDISNKASGPNSNLHDPEPPAYKYFRHPDARIQKLVRQRLPYFSPLGLVDNRGNQQLGTENLDYLGQFGQKDVPSRASGKRDGVSNGSSSTRKRKPSAACTKEASHASGNWVDPRNNAAIPLDAGKRRVRADGRQCGHWITGQNGRKVYVTKNGQELTGQIAYRQYKKDSGVGFKRSRKKATATKKTTVKKKQKR